MLPDISIRGVQFILNPRRWSNLSYANVATTSEKAHLASLEWSESLARGGSAEFDGDAEKNALLPLRNATSRLLSCDEDDICVGSSATEIICSLAWAFSPTKDSNIVSTRSAFPSTVYPWRRVAEENGANIRLADYDSNLYTRQEDIFDLIDEQTSIVAISHVEYSNGQRYDLKKISEVAHSVGAAVIVDATQSMGVLPIEAAKTGVDAIVSSGYKWLRGSYGAAVAYISPDLIRDLNPGLVGFRSHYDLWDLKAERLELPMDASRFEYTTLHFGAALGLAASINEINHIGIDEVWSMANHLSNLVIEGASKLGLEVVSPLSENERSAIVSIRPPKGLNSEHISRTLLDEFGIVVSSRSGLIRISPHFVNKGEEIQDLLDALGGMIS